jgi:hypothetical protein
MNSLLRAGAFAITIGMMTLLPSVTFLQLVTCFGLAHYIQVAFVARQKYADVFFRTFRRSFPTGALMLGILVFSLVIGLYLPDVAIRWVFGIHFVFSEVFLFQAMTTDSGKELYHVTRLHRLALNFYFYACYVYMEAIQSQVIYAAVIVAGLTLFAVYVVELQKVTGGKWGREASDLLIFEVLGLALIPLATQTHLGFAAVVVYHIAIWWLIPLKQKIPGAAKSIFIQFAMAAIFFSLIPMLHFLPRPFNNHWTWLIVFGYFHIITTLFISSYNPNFILKWNQRYLWNQSKT